MTAPAYHLPAGPDGFEPFDAGVVKFLRKDDDIVSGFWACTPEEQPDIYEAVFDMNETIYVIEGKVRVEIVDGPTYELGVGDSASFVKGTTGRWKVLEKFTEFFIYS